MHGRKQWKTLLLFAFLLGFVSYAIISSFVEVPGINVILKLKQPATNVIIQSEAKEENPKVTQPCIALSPTKPAKIGNGIARTVEEQQIEAIEILSLAVENAAAKNSKLLGINSKCDWADGKWVEDLSIKYGEGILKGYQSCRVGPRQNCRKKNASTSYLQYRWVLNDEKCESKRLRFTRELFLSTVQNRSILFIGDSLTRNMFESLVCLLYVPNDKGKTIKDHEYRYRYPDFGVTLEYVVSHWLVNETMKNCDSDPKRRLARKACIDITSVDYQWARRAEFFDIFVFATGGWWEHDLRMRQAQTLVGKRSYRTARNLMRQALVTVINYLNRPEFQTKKIYWRCSEVSHFFGGEWNTGGNCPRENPSTYPIYNPPSLFIQEAVIDSLSNTSKIKLLDITRMSSYRQDAHPSSVIRTKGQQDCKHWCLPGIPDHWNEIWLNMLKDEQKN